MERRSLDGLADMIMQGVVDTNCSARPFDDVVLLLALFEGDPSTPLPRVDRLSINRHDIQGVKAARRFVRGFLRRRGLSRLVDDMEVISSEAVTNALIHADSEVEVRLREYPDRVHLEVRDTDAKPPIPTSVTSSPATNEIAEHGRGYEHRRLARHHVGQLAERTRQDGLGGRRQRAARMTRAAERGVR